MGRFITRRLISLVVVVLGITLVVFMLSRATGDPRYLYMSSYSRITSEEWEAQGRAMGLDKPLIVQYLVWVKNAAQGDFGDSVHFRRNSLDLILKFLPATLQLSGISFLCALLIGVPLGVLSAVKRTTGWDYLGRSFALLGQAAPPFWIALVFIWIFSVYLGWLPTSRKGDWTHYVMPVITLGWLPAAGLLRLTRSSMLEVLDSEYVKLARAKGVSTTTIIWIQDFRISLIDQLTFEEVLLE